MNKGSISSVGQPASHVKNLQAFWESKNAQKNFDAIATHLMHGGNIWMVDFEATQLSQEFVITMSKLSSLVFHLISESDTEDVCKEVAEQMAMLYMICDAITHVRSNCLIKGERVVASDVELVNQQS